MDAQRLQDLFIASKKEWSVKLGDQTPGVAPLTNEELQWLLLSHEKRRGLERDVVGVFRDALGYQEDGTGEIR